MLELSNLFQTWQVDLYLCFLFYVFSIRAVIDMNEIILSNKQ